MTSIQKCFRTGDIDEVGNPRNLTFFEMLGNFSIGDYFKESIIPWAWEFVTEWLQLPPEKVYVTVHPTDDEARQIWLGIGFPAERIVDDPENWWGPPGAEGPCGPDSELYYDWGPEVGCGLPTCKPGCECDRFLEFWNLVFMQYYQDRQGNRTLLPRANVDTGSGLERVTAIMQQVQHRLRDRPLPTDHRRGGRDRRDGVRAGRADRLRLAGGGGPRARRDVPGRRRRGPRQRGARLRHAADRAAGRAVRSEARDQRPVPGADRQSRHRPGCRSRIRSFRRSGPASSRRSCWRRRASPTRWSLASERLNVWIEQAKERGESEVAGQLLFQLHDTFGFPFELSEEMLGEAGLTADRAGFDSAMEEQRTRSRATARFRGVADDRAYEVGDVPATSLRRVRPA